MYYVPIKNINVTNVFPTEPAPPGLNYYVATKHLPDIHWNALLNRAFDQSHEMAGPRSVPDAGHWQQDLQEMLEMELDKVYGLGYNPICHRRGWGTVIWGNQVVGTNWNLPQLMTVFEVMTDIKKAVDNLIGTQQMSLFFVDEPEVHQVRAIIHQVIYSHKACRDLYYQDPSNEPAVWTYGDDSEVTFKVPLQPLMIIDPLVFKLQLCNAQYGCACTVAKEFAEQYQAMQNLFGIEDQGIMLEVE